MEDAVCWEGLKVGAASAISLSGNAARWEPRKEVEHSCIALSQQASFTKYHYGQYSFRRQTGDRQEFP